MRSCRFYINLLILTLIGSTALAAVQVNLPVTPENTYSYLWSKCDQCVAPESVYFDSKSQNIFISNVVGAPDAKDGQGWIQKLKPDGTVLAEKWVEGLNAPKGMRIHNGTLWVSDIDEIVSIDVATAKIIKKYPVVGAKFLNDVAIDSQGVVYVSDTFGAKIYQLRKQKVTEFAFGDVVDGPNGLLVIGSDLYVASWGIPAADWSTKVPGHIFKISIQTKEKKFVTKAPLGNLDGLEVDQKGNFLVSDWMAGKVFRVSPAGDVTELFNGMKGSADIGFDVKSQKLFIPRMNENLITVYDLKTHPDYVNEVSAKK